MKIIYDNLVYSLQNFGGISTYWYELSVRILAQQGIDIAFYETGKEAGNIARRNLKISSKTVNLSNRGSLLIERFLKLPECLDENIFHSSYFRVPVKNSKTKVITTVHDFTHDLYYKGPRVWLHNLVKKRAITESDYIICVSNNTRNDLLHFYPAITPDKVKVVYNGVSSNFQIVGDITDRSYQPYFLFIGSREDYKNFDFALEIVSEYEDFQLYIVGAPLSKHEETKVNIKIGKRYKVFTGIDNTTLNLLYNDAFCLLYPSSYEGFGIPLLEAMRAGCPFIALNTSSIPEIAGNIRTLMSTLNMDEAKNTVEYILANRKVLVEQGLQQSQKYSWDQCFKETLNIYNL
jgi:mannosyltransferase